jgi:hypothetical protein
LRGEVWVVVVRYLAGGEDDDDEKTAGREKGEGEGVLSGGEKRVWIVKVADDVTFKR